ADLRARLGEAWPRLAAFLSRCAVAVAGELARDNEVLPAGAEVALLPPVSGGENEGMIQLAPPPTAAPPLTGVGGRPRPAGGEVVRRPGCGGVVLFLGTVRDLTDGRETVALDYEAYPGMAEQKLAAIEAELRQRWPVGDLALVHRLGKLGVGEISVAVAVSCP